MANLYIITGPAGVGKSTVSRKLAEKLSKSALIEGDEIYHQIVGSYSPAWKDGNHLDIFWKICINNIKLYLESDYDVVFNYIISPETLDFIKESFADYAVKFVVLMVDEKTLLFRDSLRNEDCQMKERCVALLNSFKNKNYNINNILDTTSMSVEETVSVIETEERFVL